MYNKRSIITWQNPPSWNRPLYMPFEPLMKVEEKLKTKRSVFQPIKKFLAFIVLVKINFKKEIFFVFF